MTTIVNTPKLHISINGNTKIGKGIASFSTLPGDAQHLIALKNGEVLTQIPGTCSHNCKYCFSACYAVNALKRYQTTCLQAWGDNTLLLRSGRLFDELDKYLTKKNKRYTETKKTDDIRIKYFRINVSGEITSGAELLQWDDLAYKHPEIIFGVYTKNYGAVEELLAKRKDTAPNFVVNISQWHGAADELLAKYPDKFNVFEYVDLNLKDCSASPEVRQHMASIKRMCPAVDQTGHRKTNAKGEPITCDKCRYCYQKTGKTTGVWAH